MGRIGQAVSLVETTSIASLSDVTISLPLSDNELLVYDSSSGEWINQTPEEAGLNNLYLQIANNLSDLNDTSAARSNLGISATNTPITDSGDYYTGTEVETALQEIGAGTTGSGIFLKLDASNDPITSDLEIQGDFSLSGNIIDTGGSNASLDVSGTNTARLMRIVTTTTGIQIKGVGNVSNSVSLISGTGGTAHLFIDNAGQVGIGTESPSGQLNVVGGTLADANDRIGNFSGTLASDTDESMGVEISVAGNTTAVNVDQYALRVDMTSGFDNISAGGNAVTMYASNVSETGNTGQALNLQSRVAAGFYGYSSGEGKLNAGVVGRAENASLNNVGVGGIAQNANAGSNIGVVGAASNSSSGSNIGGYFSLISSFVSTPTLTSAALIANNADSSSPIFLGQDNAITVFSIIDGGNVGVGTGSPGAKLDVRGDAVFNEDGGDNDFRVEGADIDDVIFVDASTNELQSNKRGLLRYSYLTA